MQNAFAGGVPRRRMLQASGAGATAAVAGCLGDDTVEETPTVFVSNTAEGTLSVIDAETDELLKSGYIGAGASFPANQYGTEADSDYHILWLNVENGVIGIDQRDLSEPVEIETGFGSNYPNLGANEEYLIIASGGTLGMDPDPDDPDDHFYLRVDADPESESFGEVTDEIVVGYEGPCDMTVGPDGEYAYAVDVANETITVLSIDPFEIATRVDVGESIVDGGDVLPFMCTATFDGQYLLVENGEGALGPEGERVGSESIWDISNPEAPEEVAKITPDDGLPGGPITSEIDPNNEAAYLFIPGAGIGVIDLDDRSYDQTIDIGGTALAAAWGPYREKLYVPVQTGNEVAVIDHEQRAVSTTIEVGEAPVGAVAGMIQPEINQTSNIRAQLASLGLGIQDSRATYCYPNCFCGR